MDVLLTGAFGNVGKFTLQELLKKGCRVRVFELKTPANEKIYKKFEKDIEIIWGDITNKKDVERAVANQDTVIHLAFVIPSLTEKRPNWTWEINVEGTRNLLNAMRALPVKPRIIFASSVSVFGKTNHLKPPRKISDPVMPTDNYSHHKVACEQLIKISGLDWTILRLGAVLGVSLCDMDPLLFSVPPDTRIELIHAHDAGIAFANSVTKENIRCRTLLIGGGKSCQMCQGDFVSRILEFIGIGMLPEQAFSTEPFYLDWMDTSESQKLLDYQHRRLEDFLNDIRKHLGFKRKLIRIFRPFIRYWLLNKSPYLRKANHAGSSVKVRLKGNIASGMN
ncbi:MAG: NAD(P)-dependent oxidoreductase [Actinomycetota bacterium]|nr:NAD(P)-dependent oxidoreductase [Actinomycetota bacterium]